MFEALSGVMFWLSRGTLFGSDFFLNLHEPGMVSSITRAVQLVTRITPLVDIHSMRQKLQIIARRLDPSHHSRLHP